MKFNLITTYDEFLSLEEVWCSLIKRMDNGQIFYQWNWVKTYLEQVDFELKNNLCIIVGFDKKKAGIILPFLKEGLTIRFITNKTVDYNNILIDNNQNKYNVILKAIDFLCEKVEFNTIDLNNFKGETELNIFQDIINNRKDLKIVIRDSVMAPILKIKDKNIKMKKKAIKDIERRERKLDELGIVSINIGGQFDKKAWNKIQEFHKKRWQKSIFFNEKYLNFYEQFSKCYYDNVEFSYIEINNEIVAGHFGFKDDKKIYYYIPSYDEKYINYGVGAILLYNIIEYYSDKILEFDFLRGNEPYKFNWTDEIVMNFYVKVFRTNISGRLNYLVNELKFILKKSRTLRKILNRN